LVTVLFWQETLAATNSVTDCMKDETNCAETDDSTNQTEESHNDIVGEEENSGSLVFELVKMFFALLLVLALIYFLLKFLNKRNNFNRVKALENLGGISVGQHKSIQIIRIGSKLYLVGVGDNVEMLQEITDEAVKQDILRSKDATGSTLPTGALLSSLIPGKKATKTGLAETDFKNLFAKELDNLKENRKKMINRRKEDSHE